MFIIYIMHKYIISISYINAYYIARAQLITHIICYARVNVALTVEILF